MFESYVAHAFGIGELACACDRRCRCVDSDRTAGRRGERRFAGSQSGSAADVQYALMRENGARLAEWLVVQPELGVVVHKRLPIEWLMDGWRREPPCTGQRRDHSQPCRENS